ncbi:hypothetical protein R1flu_011416 [Riccia fluitans]|uniref:Uncharacterized protein n=1 Tax=Riccia fluitans TaxID=41844 RepID=A0ABD1Z7R7_9MARC
MGSSAKLSQTEGGWSASDNIDGSSRIQPWAAPSLGVDESNSNPPGAWGTINNGDAQRDCNGGCRLTSLEEVGWAATEDQTEKSPVLASDNFGSEK